MTTTHRKLNSHRLSRLPDAVQRDIDNGLLDGAVMLVAVDGDIVLHEALGYAHRSTDRAMETDSVMFTASVAKHFTNALVARLIELGRLSFHAQVRDIIPEYGTHGKETTTIADLLLHRAGLPFQPSVSPEILGDIQAVTAAVSEMAPLSAPGTTISYSAVLAHSILAEIVRRLDGSSRPYRQILAEEIFQPLGMGDSCLGQRPDLADRRVPVVVRDRRPGMMDPDVMEAAGNVPLEDYEVPAFGGLTTANDLFRFTEVFRGGGQLEGTRLLSPAMTSRLLQKATGELPNNMWNYAHEMRGWREFPANLSLGFYVRGEGLFPHAFGQLASPSAFGGIGAGSNVFWVDPDSDVSFIFLSSGLIEESYAWERHQRYSDMVHASVEE